LKDKVDKLTYAVLTISLTILTAVVLIISNSDSFKVRSAPIMTSLLAQTFVNLEKTTERNAWIWTWWDYGYAIQYYARRATFHDGGSQVPPKTYFVALSFTTPDPKVAWNVINSVSVCGTKCIERMLKEGKTAEEITKLFTSGEILKTKTNAHPVYWLFTGDEFSKFYWISYFGTWDFKKLRGTHLFLNQVNCKRAADWGEVYLCLSGRNTKFVFDARNPDRFFLQLPNGSVIPLKLFAIRTPKELKVLKSKTDGNLAIEKVYTAFVIKGQRVYNWFITDIPAFNSNFNKMFILRVADERFFNLKTDFFPIGVNYKVKEPARGS
jgi:dolichyl-diphosphooligosaccharide--protein glycosyltransferase